MFNVRFFNYVLLMHTDVNVGDWLARICHWFPFFFVISSIVGMISTHLDPIIIGKALINGCGIESLLLCRWLHELDVKKVVKMINKHVCSPNSVRSEVAPNLRNGARLAWNQLVYGRALTWVVFSVLSSHQLLDAGAPSFAVHLSINSIRT